MFYEGEDRTMEINTFIRPMKVAFVGTYPPRQCGIATFTHDLLTSIRQIYGSGGSTDKQEYLQVIALNNIKKGYSYNRNVSFSIRDQYREDYRRVADYLNLSTTDVVSLQCEFGIFGGREGSHILQLLNRLNKPVVTTLHTVLSDPLPEQKKVMEQVCARSTLIVVMAAKAVELLRDLYGVPEKKIQMIHHGTHDVPFLDSSYYKGHFNADGRQVLLTFGLLDKKKGIEYVIKALPTVVEKHPDLLFVVLGATHPAVKKMHGEQYRHSLEKLVQEQKLGKNVVFHNHFVSLEQLIQFLVAADLYITPYLNKDRITSGTLAYALASGKAIISTPYYYAEELLADERGRLVPFEDPEAIAAELINLLNDENLRNKMRKNAYQFGRRMIWRETANAYARAFETALFDYGNLSTHLVRPDIAAQQAVIPEVNTKHLKIMTDTTGLFRSALLTTPDRSYGYSTELNSRALVASVFNWNMLKDESILPLIYTYLSFVSHAYNREEGRMRGYMNYERRWWEEAGTEDCHACALWSLGYTVANPPSDSILGVAVRLFQEALGAATGFTSFRARAYTILGAIEYLQRFSGETHVHDVVVQLAGQLIQRFKLHAGNDWLWCEDVVGRDSGRLAEALIAAGKYLDNQEMLTYGLNVLEWLMEIQTDPGGGNPSLIGNREWYRRGEERSRFDQLPIDINSLIDACNQAYTATWKPEWRNLMAWAFNWFFGNNDSHQIMYDYATGGCFDCLEPAGVNRNQGGEALVSYLISLLRMHTLAHQQILNE